MNATDDLGQVEQVLARVEALDAQIRYGRKGALILSCSFGALMSASRYLTGFPHILTLSLSVIDVVLIGILFREERHWMRVLKACEASLP